MVSGTDLKPYEWDKDRKRYTLSENESKFNEYLLKYHKEYKYNWEGDTLFVYYTEHRITRVTNSEAIQRHNRIYIPLRNVIKLMDIKARSISKTGKVTLFDRNNLKEIKDEETNNAYKIFAIEGIEPDSELEYFYTQKKRYSLFDTTKVGHDTLNNRNIYQVSFRNVPGLTREKISSFDANRKRIEMKLAYNYTRTNARLNTWTDAAKSYYRGLAVLNDEDEKQATKFVKTLGDDKKWPMVKRIKNIEDKIKNTIKIAHLGEDGAYESIPDILLYKQASVQGIIRLLIAAFRYSDMQYEIVMTCDRDLKKFDGSFDSWTYLSDYLLFFPATHGFLSPNENELRYPLVPAKFTAHKGLFIEPITVGSIQSGIGSIKEIPALPYTADENDHIIHVTFNEEMDRNIINQKLIFKGMNASFLATYYAIMTKEQRDKFIDELIRSSVPDLQLNKWTASTISQEELPRFEVDADFKSGHFIENAGNKVLFKVGELIGPQSELYRDENRVTEIENVNNRGYERIITIEIPKGYRITNASALQMNVVYKSEERTPFQFTSEATIEKSTLKIAVKEFYQEIYAPVSRYEEFRKVINAAADFNKIVLVLEKI